MKALAFAMAVVTGMLAGCTLLLEPLARAGRRPVRATPAPPLTVTFILPPPTDPCPFRMADLISHHPLDSMIGDIGREIDVQ